jgi:hypothetical protein
MGGRGSGKICGMSAINRLIDAQMKSLLCGTPGVFSCDCHICQRCTGCGRTKWYEREATDPPSARDLHFRCPGCNPLQDDGPIYFDRLGRVIPLDDDKCPSDLAVAWAMANARERDEEDKKQ